MTTGGTGQSTELPFLFFRMWTEPRTSQTSVTCSNVSHILNFLCTVTVSLSSPEQPPTQNCPASGSSAAGLTGLYPQAQFQVEPRSLDQCLAPRKPSIGRIDGQTNGRMEARTREVILGPGNYSPPNLSEKHELSQETAQAQSERHQGP